MRHDDICIITRTETGKDTITHIVKKNAPVTMPAFKCRLGKSSGSVAQGQPQGTYVQQMRLYISNINTDIKQGDIATINNTTKYTVGNVYKPNNHHIEVDVTYKEEI